MGVGDAHDANPGPSPQAANAVDNKLPGMETMHTTSANVSNGGNPYPHVLAWILGHIRANIGIK